MTTDLEIGHILIHFLKYYQKGIFLQKLCFIDIMSIKFVNIPYCDEDNISTYGQDSSFPTVRVGLNYQITIPSL